MKTPQVPAMPGMSPLGLKQRCLCGAAYDDEWTAGVHHGKHRCARVITAFPLNRIATDQKTVAERKWQQRKLAPAPQQPCDHGLFSDDANQKELFK